MLVNRFVPKFNDSNDFSIGKSSCVNGPRSKFDDKSSSLCNVEEEEGENENILNFRFEELKPF